MNVYTLCSVDVADLADALESGRYDFKALYGDINKQKNYSDELFRDLDKLYQWLALYMVRKAEHFANLDGFLRKCGEFILHLRLVTGAISNKSASDITAKQQRYLTRWQFIQDYLEMVYVHMGKDVTEGLRAGHSYVLPILNLLHNQEKDDWKTNTSNSIYEKLNDIGFISNLSEAKIEKALYLMRQNGLVELVCISKDERVYRLGYRHHWLLQCDMDYRGRISSVNTDTSYSVAWKGIDTLYYVPLKKSYSAHATGPVDIGTANCVCPSPLDYPDLIVVDWGSGISLIVPSTYNDCNDESFDAVAGGER